MVDVFAPTKEMYKAQKWCFDNDLRIYVIVVKGGKKICVDWRSKRMISPEFYSSSKEINSKIWQLYLYFYSKHKL